MLWPGFAVVKLLSCCHRESLLHFHQLFLDIFLVLSYVQDALIFSFSCSVFFFKCLSLLDSVVQRKSIYGIWGCIGNKSSESIIQKLFVLILWFPNYGIWGWEAGYMNHITHTHLYMLMSHLYHAHISLWVGFAETIKPLSITPNQNVLLLLSYK